MAPRRKTLLPKWRFSRNIHPGAIVDRESGVLRVPNFFINNIRFLIRVGTSYNMNTRKFSYPYLALCFSACILQIVCDILEASKEGFLKEILIGQTYELFIFSFPILNLPFMIRAQQQFPLMIYLLEEPFKETAMDYKHKKIINAFNLWTFVFGMVLFVFNVIGVVVIMMVLGPLVSLLLLSEPTPIRDLPLPVGRIPFDTDSYWVYAGAYIVTSFSLISTVLNFVSWCVPMIFCSLNIKARICILRDTLSTLDERAEILQLTFDERTVTSRSSLSKEQQVQKCFKLLFHEQIREHQNIIRFVRLVDSVYRFSLVVVKNACMGLVAVKLIHVTEMEEKPIIYYLRDGAIAIAGLITLGVFSFCGQAIITQAQKLHQDLASISWSGKPQSIQTDLKIMMSRTLIYPRLTFGGISPVSMSTFRQILAAIYFYVNILYTLKDKRKHSEDDI